MNALKFSVLVFGVLLAACKKAKQESILQYTKNMAGPHTWKGWWDPPLGNVDSFTFDQAITYVDDSTVLFWSRLLGSAQYRFWRSNEVNKTITYTVDTPYVGGGNQDTLVFDYRGNIIYYNSYSDYRGQVAVYHLHSP